MVGTFYFGFWAFIHTQALWNFPLWYALMSNALNVVFSVLCFTGWNIFRLWAIDETAIPTFKIERGERKVEAATSDEGQEKEEKLPLY